MFFSRNSSSVAAVIKSGSLKKLQKLVDAANCNALGGDVNGVDDSGNSALHVALFFDPERVEYQQVQAVVRNLLAAGAHPRLENQEGLSPLALVSQRELTSCVELMSMVPAGMSLN